MKKITLFILLLTITILAGCSGSSSTEDTCMDDGICTVKENFIGGCDDCLTTTRIGGITTPTEMVTNTTSSSTTTIRGIPLFNEEDNQYPQEGDPIYEIVSKITEDDSSLLQSDVLEKGAEEIGYVQMIRTGGAKILYDYGEDAYIIESKVGETSRNFYTYNVKFEESFDPADFKGEELKLFGIDHYILPSDQGKLDLFQGSLFFIELGETLTISAEREDYEIGLVAVNSDANPIEATIKINDKSKTIQEEKVVTISGIDVYLKDIIITLNGTEAMVNIGLGHELSFEDDEEVEKSGDVLYETYVELPFNNREMNELSIQISAPDDNGEEMLFIGDTNEENLFRTFRLYFEGLTADNGLKAWIVEYP